MHAWSPSWMAIRQHLNTGESELEFVYMHVVDSNRFFFFAIISVPKLLFVRVNGRRCRRQRRWSAALADDIMLYSTPFINSVIGPRGVLLLCNLRLTE